MKKEEREGERFLKKKMTLLCKKKNILDFSSQRAPARRRVVSRPLAIAQHSPGPCRQIDGSSSSFGVEKDSTRK